MQALDYIKVQQ